MEQFKTKNKKKIEKLDNAGSAQSEVSYSPSSSSCCCMIMIMLAGAGIFAMLKKPAAAPAAA